MSELTVEITKKRRDAKAKEGNNLSKELNTEFQRTVRRDKKQYYNNFCKDIEVGNKHEEAWKVFQKISELRRKFQLRIGMLTDANEQIVTNSKEMKG